MLVFGAYVLSMPTGTTQPYPWGTLFLSLGVGAALLCMLVAPVILGMAVVNRRRSHWLTGIIFAVPAAIGAIFLYGSLFVGFAS